MDKYIAIIFILLGVQMSFIVSEPICSKYDYDEKTLQKLIRLEFKFERLMDDMESFKNEWKNTKSNVNTKMEEMSTLLNGVNERMTNESEEWKNRKTDVDTKMEDMSTLLNGVNERMTTEFETWKNRKTDVDTKFENMSTLLNGVNERMTTEFETWKNRKTDVDTKLENMSTLVNGVNERMTTEFETWKNRKTDVDTKLEDMSTLLNGVNKRTATWFEKNMIEMEQLSTRLTNVETSSAIIAFSATNLKDTTPTRGHILIFLDIDFNVGGGYDANTGIFTAPKGGLYMFMTHICNFRGKSVAYAVINDGTEVLRSVQSDDNYYSCHSIPVVTHVRSGGEVKVQTMDSGSKFYKDYYSRLMFSGVLLNQD